MAAFTTSISTNNITDMAEKPPPCPPQILLNNEKNEKK
jgi:hypothetical protein